MGRIVILSTVLKKQTEDCGPGLRFRSFASTRQIDPAAKPAAQMGCPTEAGPAGA